MKESEIPPGIGRVKQNFEKKPTEHSNPDSSIWGKQALKEAIAPKDTDEQISDNE